MTSSGSKIQRRCCPWDKNIVHEAYQFLQQVMILLIGNRLGY